MGPLLRFFTIGMCPFLMAAPALAQATKPKKSNDKLKIDFYSARSIEHKNGFVLVEIFGKSSHQGRFVIVKDQIKLIREEKIQSINPKKVTRRFKQYTEKDGRFLIQLRLPEGQVQLPLVFQRPRSKKRKNIALSFVISKDQIQLANEKKDFDERNNFIWLGGGTNFISFSQNFTSTTSTELKFDNFNIPEFSIGYQRFFGNNYQLDFELRSSPGETRSSSNVSVNDGRYLWNALIWDNIFFSDRNYPNNLYWGWRARIQYRIGAQIQQVPFLKRESFNEVRVKNSNITFATAGLGTDWISPSRYWKIHFFMRYLYPMSSDNNFDISSPVAFEGLTGLSRLLSENWTLGFYWNGQYLDFKYSKLEDSAINANINGDLFILHSLMEARLAYAW